MSEFPFDAEWVALVDPDQQPPEDTTRVTDRYTQLTEALLDATELHRLPVPEPLVDDLLDRNTLAWLHGKPGHGKSFVALDLACHVALGRSWGHRAVTQGPVLYVAAEGAQGLRPRVEAWETGNGSRLGHGMLTVLPVAVQVTDDLVDAPALRHVADRLQPVLIVIDTQARVTVGREENSAKDMGVFVDQLERLRSVCGSTVLTVHHEPRNGENLRGSIALEGGANTVIRTIKSGTTITLKYGKQKDRPEFDDILGALIPAGDSVFYSHGAVGLAAMETKTMVTLLSVLRDSFGTRAVSATELREVSGIPKSSLYRTLNQAVLSGKVHNLGTQKMPRYVLADLDDTFQGL